MSDGQMIPLSVLRSYSPHPDKLDLTGLTQDEITHGIKSSKLPDYIRYKQYLTDTNEALAQLAEMIIQFAVNLGLDPDQTLDWARKLQQAVPQSEFDSWIATLLDGGPSIFVNTLSELQAKYPNGAAGVALVRETDPAKIYVWNGSAWEDFGDYQGIEVKDGTITPSKLSQSLIESLGVSSNLVIEIDGKVTGDSFLVVTTNRENFVGFNKNPSIIYKVYTENKTAIESAYFLGDTPIDKVWEQTVLSVKLENDEIVKSLFKIKTLTNFEYGRSIKDSKTLYRVYNNDVEDVAYFLGDKIVNTVFTGEILAGDISGFMTSQNEKWSV